MEQVAVAHELKNIEDILMVLPEYVDQADVEKRPAMPDILAKRASMLKGQQALHYATLQEFMQKEGGGFAVIKGYAGTGKTFLLSVFLEYLVINRPHSKIAVTAPTNKAVKVLKDFNEIDSNQLSFMTAHKLLGLKENIDAYGKQTFTRDYNSQKQDSVEMLELLVIDEGSMIPDDIMMMIYPYIARGLKLIVIGDPAQIPPVGETDSIPFSKRKQRQHGIDESKIITLEMTEIVRQAQGNPIIDLTLQLRKGREEERPIKERMNRLMPDATGVIWMGVEDKPLFLKFIETYFCSENFRNNADFVHIIAWRNATVAKFNSIVRGFIYGKERAKAEALILGEKLIANKPIVEELDGRTFIVMNNNDEFVVESMEVVEPVVLDNPNGSDLELNRGKFKHYKAKVRCEDGRLETLFILHEDSYEIYNDAVAALKETALAKDKGSHWAKLSWVAFYKFQEIFADVAYNYAITAHKSQGSTFDNVIVVESDIDGNRKAAERNRIKYTAFSRSRHKLVVIY